jgi:LL-diaminopimelate aminotransferase
MVLESSWIQERNEIYRQRRDVIIQSLRKLEVDIQSPQASLYIWCPIPTSWTSEKFAMAMLKEANVSVAPGTIFGSRGEGFIRISITQPRKRIEKAMQKMSTWWKTGDK